MPNDEPCCESCCHCDDHELAQDCKRTGEATTLESGCAEHQGPVFTDAQFECLHVMLERLRKEILDKIRSIY